MIHPTLIVHYLLRGCYKLKELFAKLLVKLGLLEIKED